MLPERLKLLHQPLPGAIEVLVYGLQSFGGDGFDAYESTFDVGLAHGIQVLGILG